MKDEVEVIEPRDEIDRTVVRRCHVRMFQMSIRFLDELERIALDENAKKSERIAAMRLVIERILPAVHRVDSTTVAMYLPNPVIDASGQTEDPVQRDIAAARRLLAERFGPKQIGNGYAH